MILEAIEDTYRRGTNQPQVPRRGYPIEHILPQKLADNWPVEGLEAEEARAEHVHRLGNLTLLTTSLNSKVSNGPWASKREALQQHDTLLLNSRLLSTYGDGWDEQGIESRADAMIDALLEVWPVPDGHEGVVVDPHEKSAGWIQIKHLVEAGLLLPGTVADPATRRVGVAPCRRAPRRVCSRSTARPSSHPPGRAATSRVRSRTAGGSGGCPTVAGSVDVRAVYREMTRPRRPRCSTGPRSTRSSRRCRRGTGRPTAASRTQSARHPCRWASTSRPASSARTPIAS